MTTPTDPYAFPGLSADTEAAIAEATAVFAARLRATAMQRALTAHATRIALAALTRYGAAPEDPRVRDALSGIFAAAEAQHHEAIRLAGELDTLVRRAESQ